MASFDIPHSPYVTLSIDDDHRIGRDRVPEDHVTVRSFRALVTTNCLATHIDTPFATVSVDYGGRASGLYQTEKPGVYAANLLLDDVLYPNDEESIQYHTVFNYPSAPAPLIRRTISSYGLNFLQMSVTFDPEQLPARVWWTEWEGDKKHSPIVSGSQEEFELLPLNPGELDSPLHVYTEIENVPPGKVLGFLWEWPPEFAA